MHGSRNKVLLVAALAMGMAACGFDGGRGSSGFEIRENAIIQQVLDTQQCVSGERLTFCPADQRDVTTPTTTPTAPTPGPTATRSPDASPRVDTLLANGASVVCTRPHPGATCSLPFSFSAYGVPAEASFRVAARLRAPDSPWMLAPVPTGGGGSALETLVGLDLAAEVEHGLVQFAVLIFLDAPGTVPARFETLAQSGADFGFVTPQLALEVITVGPPPTATLTPSPPASASPTLAVPTPTATPATAANGPLITYFGVARADSVSQAPSGTDASGRPIYVRPFGHGLSLVVEGRPGASRRPVGASAYTPGEAPFLQLILSRPLGDGSRIVCDRMQPTIGGVPATRPLAFSDSPDTIDAMNDLGCRVDDGSGQPQARPASVACTLDRSGEYAFVDYSSTAQFCLPIAAQWAFPAGDTIVAARLRDTTGELGPVREIVVRNADAAEASPTPVPPTATPAGGATATSVTRPTTASPTTPTAQGSASPSATVTPTATGPTRTPTPTSLPGVGPSITYFGIARANNRLLTPVGNDAGGRPIFAPRLGQGLSLIVEAAPGSSHRRVGETAYSDLGLPDLQIILSRPLGNGSALVCDAQPPIIGGVPATTPLAFSDESAQIGAINDLGCRVDDGQGSPSARNSMNACTATAGGDYAFAQYNSTAQYCLPIAAAWAFPRGDTIVAARVRDVAGQLSPVREIVVRVAP